MAIKGRISKTVLQKMADEGSYLAQMCLSQRQKLAEYAENIKVPEDPKSEIIIRELQRENDRLRAENARLRSHG